MPAEENILRQNPAAHSQDTDPSETKEWIDSLDYIIESKGGDRVRYLLSALENRAHARGVDLPFAANTPYINSIHVSQQPVYPGNREFERRIKSVIRWNAMAMVTRANRDFSGLGGHISSYASAATLYEVAFNHFFRGRHGGYEGDQVYFQGHASPGIYARAFVEGRLTEKNLENFRRELQDVQGLSSYPHPWLMPDFWEFPTVSMGLGPICSIYQARFNRYMQDRGIKKTDGTRVWAFLGDGECDEPETLGAISLAAREGLNNLTWTINCNLQRLDGPVRGNGKIIQELEAVFRGAGWNVIKVIWGSDWDPLLEADQSGLLVKRMEEVVDGQYQKYVVMPGSYIREHFFGKYPELLELVKSYSDERLEKMLRGGHDPAKVYAAYKAAVECTNKPTVILAKTVKGYGLGEAGEGRNVTHNQKKLNEKELADFRNRFSIPISDEEVVKAPFYRPPEGSAEMKYLVKRREALGGFMPTRPTDSPKMDVPALADYQEFLGDSGGKELSTTMGFVRLLSKLVKDKSIGKNIVPIVPDESRTFGMEGMFRQIGIYAHGGQLYEPVDSDQLMYYKEAKDGQILEEGITEAGSMSSFIAAGNAYCQHGINMVPFFIYYSMFGFQRVGDLVWAAADTRAKGFLIGGTAGRTTLNGEGLQHQDGHSHLNAIAFPTVRSYDPAFAYETTVIIFDGMKKMYVDGETAMYYITVGNENYAMPAMPEGAEEGIVRGIYKYNSLDAAKGKNRVQLFGSGPILRCVLEAQQILADKYQVSSDVWSVTSYTELRRDAHACQRWNMFHPTEEPRKSYLEQVMEGVEGPFIASSDNVRALPEQIRDYLPGNLLALGTDGMGRSETREALRRHFEIDAASVVIATLYQLFREGKLDAKKVAKAIKDLDYNPEKVDPYFA
ncbi:pyruvate dehydrogenase (acetyl-transferring), homodimeric type [Blastopirellula sp. JC732]|uniref:Pyruvate dehydrogenase E1 component n=2 Tax=Blastopirellula sediminis TaxID=2894196 RepID=A0A9X1SEU5_9BACT|nr:pyruvate dehydrogenase (acetyl-transferring), homodimeric type [Blastopirellula sediminis]MCC9609611.1 pyruvate dehydrogenase (acetyl-transferring), homodimeric type [Blastopirellula sediminis]MCC9627613.1 pyruvate dehydrogenase (acetyl-transferring), homodimeric type [Blastopirellula sediminis]